MPTQTCRQLALIALTGLVLGCFSACGPHLRTLEEPGRVFVSTERCTQGPLELRATASGALFGEGFELSVRTTRRLHGRVQITVDGTARASTAFTAGPPAPLPTRNDAGVIVEPAPEDHAVESTVCRSTPSAFAPANQGVDLSTGRPLDPPSTQTYETPPVGSFSVARFEEIGNLTGDGWALTELQFPARASALAVRQPPISAGATIVFQIWSVEPMDLKDVWFVLRHTTQTPSGTEEEYLAMVLRSDREIQARARAEQEEANRRGRERQAYCQAHHESESCWGRGGYEGAVRSAQREQFCAENLNDTTCWGPGGYAAVEARRRLSAQAWEQAQRDEERRRRVRDPERPPPAPRPELRPPSPSAHAEWIPGYWFWNSTDFGWISGHWLVPETDRSGGLTASAPQAPPTQPQLENRPETPATEAIWTSGYWAWNGSVYIWIQGSWQLPPLPSAQWQAPIWRPAGLRFVFDPGQWLQR